MRNFARKERDSSCLSTIEYPMEIVCYLLSARSQKFGEEEAESSHEFLVVLGGPVACYWPL